MHATPYRNGAGEIIGTLGALTDITQRRELEGQLRQSQKMEAVGQLAAGIAHNFNNMLQAIMGSLSVALMKAQGDLKSPLLDAEESSQRASEIVRQLMLFARHGRRGEFRPVNLQHALANTVDLCRRSFDRRIDVSLRVPETLPTVDGDSGQLQQVLLNVCLNARDALEGVVNRDPTIRIDAETLSVPGDDGQRKVEIRVTDNGIGIDPEVLDQVFEPFFSTKDIGRGTGLGLATVYAIVQHHKGSIECESELGNGTTFVIRLPVAEASVEDGPDAVPDATPSGTETVLIVDDEAGIRNSLGRYLTKLGYRVLIAEDGRAGLELYKSSAGRVDLVLLDLSMPRMSGQEVLQALRVLNPEVRVIVFTGYPVHEEEFESVPPVLLKPVEFAVVARRIRALLDEVSE